MTEQEIVGMCERLAYKYNSDRHRQDLEMEGVRCAKDTQVETQYVAWAIHYEMAKLFPVSWEALNGETE